MTPLTTRMVGSTVVQHAPIATPAEAGAAPVTVTKRQAIRALFLAGHLDSVQPAIDAITDATQRRLVQIDWDQAQEFRRDDPTLMMLAAALGLTESALDALFILAAQQ